LQNQQEGSWLLGEQFLVLRVWKGLQDLAEDLRAGSPRLTKDWCWPQAACFVCSLPIFSALCEEKEVGEVAVSDLEEVVEGKNKESQRTCDH